MGVKEECRLVARPNSSLGVCPGQELNLKPLGVRVDTSTS